MTADNDIMGGNEKVQELLAFIDSRTEWVVTDYNPDLDPYELPRVTLRMEHQPNTETIGDDLDRPTDSGLKELISALESESDEGAYIGDILISAHHEWGMSAEDITDKIFQLQERGEVYEPKIDRYKTA